MVQSRQVLQGAGRGRGYATGVDTNADSWFLPCLGTRNEKGDVSYGTFLNFAEIQKGGVGI